MRTGNSVVPATSGARLSVWPQAAIRDGAVRARRPGLDILRGLAIVLMIGANTGAELLEAPHPFWFRLIGSFAAPVFVTLAGLVIGLAASGPARPGGWRRCLKRAGFVLLMAVWVDLAVGRYVPGMTCDVLYLIALSLPAAFLMARAGVAARWVSPLLVLAVTPWAQSCWGYRVEITQPAFEALARGAGGLLPGAIRRFLIDGWFPVLPWLGFALFGVALASLPERWRPWRIRAGAALVGVGAIVWLVHPGALAERNGYSELFYPATLGYVLTALGVTLILLELCEAGSEARGVRWLSALGRCSLLIYMVHLVVIEFVLRPVFGPLPLVAFLLLIGNFVAMIWALAAFVELMKRRYRERGAALPLALATLLGA